MTKLDCIGTDQCKVSMEHSSLDKTQIPQGQQPEETGRPSQWDTLDSAITFWQNTQNDPHGIAYAVYIALSEVRRCLSPRNINTKRNSVSKPK